MGPWLESMSDEMKVLADFVADIDFHRLDLDHADVKTTIPNEPAVTLVESFESGLNNWAKWGNGASAVGTSDEHATDGTNSCVLEIDMDTYDAMPSPESGIQKYKSDGFGYNWTSYWPHGTFKMDLHIPEFYDPEHHPDGFLLGINKDPRSILEIHCTNASGSWTYYSTTNEFAADNGWKKLTVGMTWHLELPLSLIPTEFEAANITGFKFWFGDIGILKGPIYIDNMTAGLFPFNTVGMISSNGQFAFAWIQDRRWTNSLTCTNGIFQVNGLDPGTYNVEWWNTLSGPFASVNANASTGTLSVSVPDFLKDVAVKVRRVGNIGATVHDVAIASVEERDWVTPSTTQEVDVLVVNQGTAGETFDVTLTDITDSKVLGTNSVMVSAGSNVVSSFVWNNTNGTLGVWHTLQAVAATVGGESDTSDNQMSGDTKLLAADPPWDSCDRLRRWAPDAANTDARTLVVSTNYSTEETHSFEFYHRSPDKEQAYFGFDNIYEDWSNNTAFVYDIYVDDSTTNAQILLRTGADWTWYYSKNEGVSPGWNTDVTFYFQSNVWTKVEGTNDPVYNVSVGGREEMQQIFIKVMGYTNDGTVYVDNMRLLD
jgi:hypothetical protein